MSQMNEKEKIVAVLLEAVKLAKINKLKGVRLSHRFRVFKDSEVFEVFKKQLDEKIAIFNDMPIECKSYEAILNNAKVALLKIRVREFSFHVKELINDFLSLNEVYKRNDLKYVGVRDNTPIPILYTPRPDTELPLKRTNSEDSLSITYLAEGVTGKELVKVKEQEIKIDELIEGVEL